MGRARGPGRAPGLIRIGATEPFFIAYGVYYGAILIVFIILEVRLRRQRKHLLHAGAPREPSHELEAVPSDNRLGLSGSGASRDVLINSSTAR